MLTAESDRLLTMISLPILLITWFWLLDLRFNLSSSMPIGLYRLHPYRTPERGDWVAVRMPNARHSLIKQIIAIPGDEVSLTDHSITVNGKEYLAPKLIDEAPSNKNGYWLYGMNDPIHSWDSRYFGAVTEQAIQGVVTPLILTTHAELPAEWKSSRISL